MFDEFSLHELVGLLLKHLGAVLRTDEKLGNFLDFFNRNCVLAARLGQDAGRGQQLDRVPAVVMVILTAVQTTSLFIFNSEFSDMHINLFT